MTSPIPQERGKVTIARDGAWMGLYDTTGKLVLEGDESLAEADEILKALGIPFTEYRPVEGVTDRFDGLPPTLDELLATEVT